MTAQSFAITMRDRAIAVLTNATPAQDRLFKGRSWKVRPEEMPAILTFFHEEDQTSAGMGAPPTFVSAPKLIFDLYMRGDDSGQLEYALDGFRQLVINLLMSSVDFLAAPLEKVTRIQSLMLEVEGEHQYQRAQVMLTLQTTELYEPVLPNQLALIDARFDGPKGDTIAEAKIMPQG